MTRFGTVGVGAVRYWSIGAMLVIALPASRARGQEQTTQQLPAATGQIQSESKDKRWQITFDSDFRNIQTKETSGATPATLWTRFSYAPIGLQLAVIPNDDWKLEVGGRSGYIRLHQTSNLGGDATYNGWTDTSLNGAATYYGFSGFQPFLGLALNLPTGQSRVTGSIAAAPADQDVTGVGGTGEGFNIGPTLGVNVPITPDLLATLSLGYTSRGRFTRSGANIPGAPFPGAGLTEDISPGDVTTLTASLGYQKGAWLLQGAVAYSYEGVTQIDRADIYKSGQKFAVNGALGYTWTENLSSKVSASFTHINRDKFAASVPLQVFNLVLEQFNTNSDVTTVGFDTTYKLQKWAFGPTAGYLYRDHNGYDISLSSYLSAKTKWTAGAAAQYAINNQFSLNARLERLWMTAGEMPAQGTAPFDTRGWTVSVGGKAVF